MQREVILSKRAAEKLTALFGFLEKEWSIGAKRAFVLKLERALKVLTIFPNSFEVVSAKRGIRRCVITRQTTIYYTYTDTQVFIITVFDNRQDPERLKKEL